MGKSTASEARQTRYKSPFHLFPELANKNAGYQVKFEFQIINVYFEI